MKQIDELCGACRAKWRKLFDSREVDEESRTQLLELQKTCDHKDYTPDLIEVLAPGEIFVFGSNLRGIHGAGAAKQAKEFGACLGVGWGRAGETYAIPTKVSPQSKALGLRDIEVFVSEFINYAKYHPELRFLVTKVGCGLAGYKADSIAPMFKPCLELSNVLLPLEFHKVYETNNVSALHGPV